MISEAEQPNLLDREILQKIRRKARQLVGKAGFRSSDCEDIEQELALRLLEGMRNFKPERGQSGPFVSTILCRAANSLLRAQNARKRQNIYRHRPLVNEGDDSTMGDIASTVQPSHEARVDLAHDVAKIVDRLPQRMRELAESLKHETIGEIARRDDVSRSAIYGRIARLRKAYLVAQTKNTNFAPGALSAFCEE